MRSPRRYVVLPCALLLWCLILRHTLVFSTLVSEIAPTRMVGRRLSPSSVWDAGVLKEHMQAHSVKPSHIRSVWKLAYHADSMEEVADKLASGSNPPPARWIEALRRDFVLCTSSVIDSDSKDPAKGCKLVLRMQDGLLVEAVVMLLKSKGEDNDRITLCVSSQAGCRMACTFCETGRMGHLGDLTAGEIVEQIVHAERFALGQGQRRVRNIVFMGMGEPLDNYDAVHHAVECMMSDASFRIRANRITISTVGVVPRIRQLAADAVLRHVNLAVSLHSATQAVRLRIVPTAQAYPVEKLVESIKEYCDSTGRDVMVEYIVLSGVNDSEDDAKALAELLRGLNVWINLIPYNPTSVGESNGFRSPSNEIVREFDRNLRRFNCIDHRGNPVVVRARFSTEGGRDTNSACGQLATVQYER
mmetsp:Transcript_17573/g.56937  ORF Transcript_17573/g.56937 Transcript_17573/m.56937 type:complete len:417 (+) Transcript_17573:76-1326(+)